MMRIAGWCWAKQQIGLYMLACLFEGACHFCSLWQIQPAAAIRPVHAFQRCKITRHPDTFRLWEHVQRSSAATCHSTSCTWPGSTWVRLAPTWAQVAKKLKDNLPSSFKPRSSIQLGPPSSSHLTCPIISTIFCFFLPWYPWPYPFRALPPPPGFARPHRALSLRTARPGGPGGSSQRWRWAAPAGHCHGARVAPAPWDSKCRRPVRKNKRSTTRRRPGKRNEGCLYLLHPVTMIEIPWFHDSSMFIMVCPWSVAINGHKLYTRRRKPPKRPLGELQIPRPCKSCWVMVGVW